MARDADRSRCYDAEQLVRRILDRSAEFPIVQLAGSQVAVPVERRFGRVADVQRYADAVLALPAVRRGWPGRASQPVLVRERAGAASAHYERDGAVVAIPVHADGPTGTAWAMRELVILHELAHHLDPDERVLHDAAFRARLIELAEVVIAQEAGLLLRVSYAEVGLR